MQLNDHYSSSTNPHRALMVICTLLVGSLGLGLYVGWARYFRVRSEREAWVRSGIEVERKQAEQAKRSMELALPDAGMSAPAAPPLTERRATLGDMATTPDLSLTDGLASPTPIAGEVPADLVAKGTEVIQQFWHSPTWKEKVAFVRQPELTGPCMQTFYEVDKQSEPVAGALLQSARFQLNGQEVLLLMHSGTRASNLVELALVKDAKGTLQLDWESYVGWSEMDLPTIKKQRPTQPVLVRVFARRGHYYNYEFADEARYLSVQIFSPDMLTALHVYAERSSPMAAAIEEIFARSPGSDPALTLRIAFPDKAESDHALRLTGIVSDRWLVIR